MIPLLLIIANSVAKVVPALAGIQPVLAFLGEPFMAVSYTHLDVYKRQLFPQTAHCEVVGALTRSQKSKG